MPSEGGPSPGPGGKPFFICSGRNQGQSWIELGKNPRQFTVWFFVEVFAQDETKLISVRLADVTDPRNSMNVILSRHEMSNRREQKDRPVMTSPSTASSYLIPTVVPMP